MRNVYGPAFPYDGMPEGTTVGANEQFVAFSIGFGEEHLLLPGEVDIFIELLNRARTEQLRLKAVCDDGRCEHTKHQKP